MGEHAEDDFLEELVAKARDQGSLSADEIANVLDGHDLDADAVERLLEDLAQRGVSIRGPDLPEFERAIERLLREPSDGLLPAYLRHVSKIDPSPSDDVALDAPDRLKRLAERYQWLTVTIAARYEGEGLLLEDLIGSANRGLLYAIGRFDPEKRVPFTAYAALWLRRAVARVIADQGKTISIPFSTMSKVLAAQRQLRLELGRDPAPKEVAVLVDVQPDVVASILRNPPNLKPEPVYPSLN
jgi:RNA polymerase primary sigma factor